MKFMEKMGSVGERGSDVEVVTSPPLSRKAGCSRPTMIHAHCLRKRQYYRAQKNNQKMNVVLKQGHNSSHVGLPLWMNRLNLLQ